MDVRKAKAGLMYADIKAAVREVYETWGVECQEDELEAVVILSGHMRLVIRDEYRRGVEQGEKRTAMVFDIHRSLGMSESMVRKVVDGVR